MILVDNYTPIFNLVIKPNIASLCLIQWRLTLDVVKMRGMKLPRMSANIENYNTFWIKERCTFKLIRVLDA